MLGEHARRQLVGEAAVDADGEHAFHRQHAFGGGERLGRADMEPVAVMDTPNSRPAASARFQSCSSEKRPSGESRNRRASQTDTLAKT